MVLQGKTSVAAYFNKNIRVSAWAGSSETSQFKGDVDANGNFVINVDLTVFPLNTDGYFHVWVYESSADDAALIYPESGEKNLLVAECVQLFPDQAALGNTSALFNYIKHVGQDGLSYYIGHRWEGLMIHVTEEAKLIEMDNASLVQRDGKIYYVLTGTCGTYFTSETFVYGFYLQHNNTIDQLGEGEVYDDTAFDKHAVVSNGEFEISLCVSDAIGPLFSASADAKWGLYVKFHAIDNLESNLHEIKPATTGDAGFELSGIRYSLYTDSADTWGMAALVLEKVQ